MALAMARNQRGAGSIGCLLLLALLGAGMYAGFQFGMPRLRHGYFEDRMNETVPHLQRETEENIRRQIIEVAKEFDIALTPEQVKVDISSSKVKIDVNYEKLIDLEVWQTTVPYNLRRSISRY